MYHKENSLVLRASSSNHRDQHSDGLDESEKCWRRKWGYEASFLGEHGRKEQVNE